MAINGFNVQCNVSSISLRRLVSTVEGIQAGLYGGAGAAAVKEGRKGGRGVCVGGGGKRKWVTKWSNWQLPTTRRANDRAAARTKLATSSSFLVQGYATRSSPV